MLDQLIRIGLKVKLLDLGHLRELDRKDLYYKSYIF